MSCNEKNLLIRDGLSQGQRLLATLKPSYVKVDERNLADFLLFAERYGSKLIYYDQKNQREGSWSSFFANDITSVLASISKKDTSSVEGEFQNLLNALSKYPDKPSLQNTIQYILDIAGSINDWDNKITDDSGFKNEIQNLIKGELHQNLTRAIQSFKFLDSTTKIENEFNASWLLPETLPADRKLFDDLVTDSTKQVALDLLISWFGSFYDAQSKLINSARNFIPESINKISWHKPHMALFLTFLKIFEHAQNHINTLTKSHLDFYYEEVLGITPKPEVADVAHLLFEPAKNVDSALVKKGTLLRAGKDKTGKDLFYQTDDEIVINQSRIARLMSVYVDKKNNSKIYCAPVSNSKDGNGKKFEEVSAKWYAFGQSQKDKSISERTMQAGHVGFAIASPDLMLKEGNRTIKIVIRFNALSNKIMEAFDAIYQSKFIRLPSAFKLLFSGEKKWIEPSANPKSINDIYNDIVKFVNQAKDAQTIKDCISLDPMKPYSQDRSSQIIGNRPQGGYTSITDLLSKTRLDYSDLDSLIYTFSDRLRTDIDLFNNQLIIQVTLNETLPSVVPYESIFLGETFETVNPLVKILLNEENEKLKTVYPYELFRHFIINSISISVHVSGIKQLVIQNDQSFLDAGKPFQPFGANPVVGSNLYIGNGEVFLKSVKDLKLKIQWMDLPKDLNGFSDHYHGYVSIPKNDDFKIQSALLKDGNWIGRDSKNLFNSVKGKLNDDVEISFDFLKLKLKRSNQPQAVAGFDNKTLNGFLRISLSDPSYAFQHKEFPNLYTKAAIALAKTNEGDLPNKPYTPTIKSVSLDYSTVETNIDLSDKASDQLKVGIDLGKESYEKRVDQFFHINPFGQAEKHGYLDRDTSDQIQFLLPQYPDEGNFYIGLVKVNAPQNISMLFQVADGSSNPDSFLDKNKAIRWAYLTNNHWTYFETFEVLTDTTLGLTVSGIIEFAIPRYITNENTCLPSGYYWLRATLPEKTDAVCQLIDIQTQAITVSYINKGNAPDRLKMALPAGSINRFDIKDAAIAKVIQPFASYNGKVKEQSEDFYTRVSERLRHKNRGITISDYERIVLERFPSVYKARCLNHTCVNYKGSIEYSGGVHEVNHSQAEVVPGHVTVIVISNLRNKNAVNPLEPKASVGLLDEIKVHLKNLISPFVRLEVRNPFYEKVIVDFKVAFVHGTDKGYYETVLNDDIIKFLSPWAYGEGEEMVFGGKIHRSVILNYIEERDYVDYVEEFKMFLESQPGIDVEEAIPTTSSTIFVSSPKHNIYSL